MPKIPFWVFIIIGLLYFTAIRVDTMDVDASQYAEISREMMKSGNYLQIFDRGNEYLDKPPLLFWLSAFSMSIFGVGNLGFKLPSILFALWSLFATYRLARNLYNDTTGRIAALILATCQGLWLMTNDIRCDTILMSCTVTAIWMLQEWRDSRKLLWMLGAAVFIGLGMMTKGPIALLVPGFCYVADVALKRQWKQMFSWHFIPAIVVIAIVLLPMSIGLYRQFDLHPEKIVNGNTGVSGLRFFYWSQSFGRITGESPWNNGAKLDFLFVSMLWAFLPWIILFVAGLIVNIIDLVRSKFVLPHNSEWVTTGGFLLAYLALGSSAYQLPHYIFVVFPLAAIITAAVIARMCVQNELDGMYRIMMPAHMVVSVLLLFAALLLIGIIFPIGPLGLVFWGVLTAAWVYFAARPRLRLKLLWLPAIAITVANMFVTNSFYYNLLKYQLGSQLGHYIKQQQIDPATIGAYHVEDPLNALHFYANGVVKSFSSVAEARQYKYVLTMQPGLNELRSLGITYDLMKAGEFFKVSELTLPFLNPQTRPNAVKRYFLVRLAQ